MTVSTFALEPYLPLLKKYFGLPFEQLELELMAAKHDPNPEDKYRFEIWEYVSMDDIVKAWDLYLDDSKVNEEMLTLLWLVANLYYEGNIAAHEDALIEEDFIQIENAQVREEIAQLYSFMQKRKTMSTTSGKYRISSKPIKFVSGKDKLEILDSCGWFEALLENYLFPNCLPDVENDEDAQKLWKKEKKVGRKERKEVNSIIYGVATYLRDKGVVKKDVTAPTDLCKFIRGYLEAMGYLEDPNDALSITPEWIKTQIHRFEETKPQFDNVIRSSATIEEQKKVHPDDQAHFWLFQPKRSE